MADQDTRTHDVAVLPGDGIGNKAMPPALEVLDAAGRRHGFAFRWVHYDWGCERFLKTGSMMAGDAIDQVRTNRRHRTRDRRGLIPAAGRRRTAPGVEPAHPCPRCARGRGGGRPFGLTPC